jgi:hypothetical protein
MRNVKAGKDFHIRISESMADRLRVMAEFHNQPENFLAAILLEEIIAGKFHSFSMAAKRINSLGLTGIDRDE